MLEVRDGMTRWDLSPPPLASVHQSVRRRCYATRDVDLKQVGIHLDTLRSHRGVADYETTAAPAFAKSTKAHDLIRIATLALTLFDALDADVPRRVAVYADIQKVNP
jgi:hypothetical protein